MPNLNDVLAGVGAGLEGGFKGYSWAKEFAQEDKKIAQQAEIAKLREEVKQMIASLNAGTRVDVAEIGAGSRRDVAEIGAGSRVDVATINQAGADGRHDRASGNTILTEGGRNTRHGIDNTRAYDSMNLASEDRRYVHDTASGGAKLSAATTQRGQDITAGTARRGQDITATLGSDRNRLTARGQDQNFQLGTERNSVADRAARSRAGGTAGFSTAEPGGDLPITPRVPRGDVNLPAPPAAFQPSDIPVTPRQSAVPPPASAGGANPLAALEQQAAQKLAQFRAEKDPARKKALAAELAALKQQRDALQAGGR